MPIAYNKIGGARNLYRLRNALNLLSVRGYIMENFQNGALFANANFNQLSLGNLNSWERLESKKHIVKGNNVDASVCAEKIVSVKKRGFKLFNWKPSRF